MTGARAPGLIFLVQPKQQLESKVMKTMNASLLLSLLGILGSGCSDINANTDAADQGAAQTRFNGSWQVAGRTKTAYPGRVEKCGYGTGTGTLTVEGNRITGDIVDNSGYAYVVEATIDEAGNMSGGMTYQGYDAATFDGLLSDSEGGGVWKDINSCPGTWEVKRLQGSKQIVER